MAFTTIAAGRIEYELVKSGASDTPPFVVLHEGLGSVSMWKDFPTQLAQLTKRNVFVYSRHGYGRSAPLPAPRTVRYMHDEALVVLPQLLEAWGVAAPILLSHSDGASIALIHAGGSGRPVAGVVAIAPHVMVEDVTVTNIAAAKRAYETANLREKLARYHDDVDGAFRGWNDIWLHPAFRSWNIEEYLPRIECSVLAIQGEDDEYATMDQIERIARGAADVELLKLSRCRHSPHRDQPAAVLEAVRKYSGNL